MTKIIFVLIAIEAFRSVADHKTVHSKGDTLETEDVNRVNNLVSRGLAKLVSVKTAEEGNDGAKGNADAGNGGKQGGTVTNPGKVVFEGNEYDPQVIKNALIAIGVPVAPNAGVNGLTKKIGEITEDQKASLAEKLSVTE
jgi:hypothetical protein